MQRKKYALIVFEEDGDVFPLSHYTDHPWDGRFLDVCFGDIADDLNHHGKYEGMFYALYHTGTGMLSYSELADDIAAFEASPQVPEYGYRTEAYGGSGVWDLAEIIYFEFFELGNTGILTTLAPVLSGMWANDLFFWRNATKSGEVSREVGEERIRQLCQKTVDSLNEKLGTNYRYGL